MMRIGNYEINFGIAREVVLGSDFVSCGRHGVYGDWVGGAYQESANSACGSVPILVVDRNVKMILTFHPPVTVFWAFHPLLLVAESHQNWIGATFPSHNMSIDAFVYAQRNGWISMKDELHFK